MPPLFRFVSWAAVSSLPQAKKISIEDQLETNREHVARHGGQLVAELVVPGESRNIVLFEDAARRMEAYASLRELIDRKAFDVLVYLDRSRLGRKASLSMAVVELCHEAGIITYETENPPATLQTAPVSHDDMLLGAIKSVGAQREVEKLQERHRMGMIARIRKGQFPGAVPYGWVAVYASDGTCSIETDPDAAAILRTIFLDMYLQQGLGQATIAERLNEMGHSTPRGGSWQKQNVHQFFLRVWRYAGYGEINVRSDRPYARGRGNWPAIITDEEAQAIITEQARRRNARRSVASTYLFSQCVWCAECGRRMIMATNVRQRKSRRIQQSLRCNYMEQAHGHRFISVNKVRAAVAVAIEYLESAANREQVLANAEGNDAERVRAEIATAKEQIEETRRRLHKADDAYIAGRMDEERYQRQVKLMTAQTQKLEQAIQAALGKLEQIRHEEQRGERLEEIAGIGLAMLNHADERTANAWLRRHFRIWVKDREVVRIDYL